jgi:hypothetical protein
MNALVVVPVYDEGAHLLGVLRRLRAYVSDILVVDDGSPNKDFVNELNEEGFNLLSLPFNLGHWGAVQAGFRYALAKGYNGVITFDGDGQHLPEEVPKIQDALDRGYDLVIGEYSERGSRFKKACWRLLKQLSGLAIHDITSGFRGYSCCAMRRLIQPVFSNLEFQDLGVLFLAKKCGLKMIEVPVKMTCRLGEKSKVYPNLVSIARYFLITLTFILAKRP